MSMALNIDIDNKEIALTFYLSISPGCFYENLDILYIFLNTLNELSFSRVSKIKTITKRD